MNGKSITVVIDPMGNPKIEANGFMGAGCEAATAPLEKALMGEGGVSREVKGEYYQAETQGQGEVQSW